MTSEYFPDYNTLKDQYSRRFPVYTKILEELVRRIENELNACETRFSVKYRIKSFSSYYKKLLDKVDKAKEFQTVPSIYDILGMRIVCPFLEDIKRVENILKTGYGLFRVERKGAEHSFKEFGYESTHLLIELPEEIGSRYPDTDITACEVQIRTILQDAWSEVEHELVYKADFTPYDESLRRKLAALNANLSLSDVIFQEIRDYQRRLHNELNKRRISFIEHVEQEKPGFVPRKIAEREDNEEGPVPGGFSDSVDDLLLKALHAHNMGNFYKAIEFYDTILQREIKPEIKSVIMVHRGMAFFAAADYDKALHNFLEAAELEPENRKVFYYLGIVHRVMNNTMAAVEAFKKSLELFPFCFESLFGLAQTYLELGDCPAAIEYCERALKIVPDERKAIDFRKYVIKKMGM